MLNLPRTKSCFVCGAHNPIGLQLQMETDGTQARVLFKFKPEHCGFRETVHGGLISTVLDEIMVWAIGVQARRFAYCAELNVRFLKPVSPNVEIEARASKIVNKRNRLFEVEGEIVGPGGEILATASGRYLALPDVSLGAMMADFVDDPSSIIGPKP